MTTMQDSSSWDALASRRGFPPHAPPPEAESPDRTGAAKAPARPSAFDRTRRLASLAAAGVLASVLLLLAAATVPVLFGYHVYAVEGRSMEPSLSLGSVAVTKPTSVRALDVGDIIAYKSSPDSEHVLHRVVEITEVDGQRAFVTQGDQNVAPDPTPVVLQGNGDRVVYSVPYAGYVLGFVGSLPGQLLFIGAPIALLAAQFLSDFTRNRAGGAAAQPATRGQPAAETGRIIPWPETPPPIEVSPADGLRAFLLQHSGRPERARQCERHPAIYEMSTLQVLGVLMAEAGIVATRHEVARACAELGLPWTGMPRVSVLQQEAA